MTRLVFYTPTILPKACLFTMGVSVKEGENPIGFFGTGLKYAIAVILRLEGKIKINIDDGTLQYTFNTVDENVRGKEFKMIDCHIHDEDVNTVHRIGTVDSIHRMPMTTDYGKAWAPWMALRELYSNTIDENGEIWWEDDVNGPRAQRSGTYITVDCDEVTSMWEPGNRTSWLLDTKVRAPVWKSESVEVYLQSSDTLFYRGIRVSQPGFKSALTYNIVSPIALTEDRTCDKWEFQYTFGRHLVRMNASDACRKLLEASGNNEYVESGMYLTNIHFDGSTQMQEEALRMYRHDPNTLSSMARESTASYIRTHHFDEMYEVARLTEEQNSRANECMNLLEDHGFEFHRYKIRWTNSIFALGQADFQNNTIIMNVALNLDAFDWKEKTCTTLIEEFIHLEFQVNDNTRNFQNAAMKMIYEVMEFKKIKGNDSLLVNLERLSRSIKVDKDQI